MEVLVHHFGLDAILCAILFMESYLLKSNVANPTIESGLARKPDTFITGRRVTGNSRGEAGRSTSQPNMSRSRIERAVGFCVFRIRLGS